MKYLYNCGIIYEGGKIKKYVLNVFAPYKFGDMEIGKYIIGYCR